MKRGGPPPYVKPEVVAIIGGRRCAAITGLRRTAVRDANAVACRMDRAGRLWVAISVARSDVWPRRPPSQNLGSCGSRCDGVK